MALEVQVEWTPRSGNKEADELANANTGRFSEALRVEIVPGEFSWQIHPEAPRLGRGAEEMYDVAKRDGALPNRGRKQKRKRAEERLKFALFSVVERESQFILPFHRSPLMRSSFICSFPFLPSRLYSLLRCTPTGITLLSSFPSRTCGVFGC